MTRMRMNLIAIGRRMRIVRAMKMMRVISIVNMMKWFRAMKTERTYIMRESYEEGERGGWRR